ncbi:recombinase family protein [Xanthobacter flavus]|uniref:recombinase family protein n=2 Tax=Xanthobacter TaxID=279 RepID=UPI00372718AC
MNVTLPVASRAALYLRVSTTRQAEVDLSIPDQRLQTAAYCQRQGWPVLAEYVEPGASAMDDNRHEFQRMIERACDDDHPFDVVVVHSFSRFFRDAFGLEMYIRRLAKHGVRLISITQELGDDPAQVMMRQVIALFDEYQSRENAKHVLRAMKENARQGFYNGARLPLGFTLEEVEKRGHRTKKRIIVDPVEAELVRLMFDLYLQGDGSSGPMGIKEITKHLNARGYRTRLGARFGVGTVHGILTNTVYVGAWSFNKRNAKTGQVKPQTEVIPISVPAMIDRTIFDKVQKTLKAKSPQNSPPRAVTGPILLTGLAYCASCGCAMTLRTGTSKTGRVYRYYNCSSSARVGETACKGRSVPMDKLDQLVTQHVAERILLPERLEALLQSVADRRLKADAEVQGRIEDLRHEAGATEDKLRRLYELVEDGLTDLDDMLKERIAALKSDRDRARSALERIANRGVAGRLDPDRIARFGQLMRTNITEGAVPFRKAYLRSLIEAVEIDDHVIRIHGSKTVLERAVLADRATHPGVRGFVRKWRSQGDSNPCFRCERENAWAFADQGGSRWIVESQYVKPSPFAGIR